MRKIFTFFAIVFFLSRVNGQITLANTFTSNLSVFKTHQSGYKMAEYNYSGFIRVFNLNNTLWNNISIPSQPWSINKVGYVTQKLFDTDTTLEYFVYYYPSNMIGKFYIYNEDGTVLFSKDSVGFTQNVYYHPHALNIADFIYFDGTSTKMKLVRTSGVMEIYNLPGTIPCIDCAGGVVSGFLNEGNNGNQIESPKFFPNPASDQLKLRYKLPSDSHLAEMKIYDMQGKLVDEFKVTDTFDFIYLPTGYNNGLYLYSLIVDGKVVKTEKIVLNK